MDQEFKVRLHYAASSKSPWATRDPISKGKTTQNKTERKGER